ncbi:DUF4157 domain-containing protein [Flavihumibacter sp. R14]|nr:DUF4157 domain-containing protein [Flavihumibacter soli]
MSAVRSYNPESSPSASAKPAAEQDSVSQEVHLRDTLHGQDFLPQCKLVVGAPDDPYEKEADAVADRVMRMPEPETVQRQEEMEDDEPVQLKSADASFIQRACACEHEKIQQQEEGEEDLVQPKLITGVPFIQRQCDECKKEPENPLSVTTTPFIQTKANGTAVPASDSVRQAIQTSKGGGNVMDSATHNFMSSRIGVNFSSVKIHSDNIAVRTNRELNARAFTVGDNIYFNEGEYQPHTNDGKRLLAHELTHVMQQNGMIHTKLIQRKCHEDTNPSKTVSDCPEGATDIGRQPQDQPNTLDARANAIIATATASGSNADKALQVVHDMICIYMPGQASKVRKINYFSSEQGLSVQSVGSGATTRGDICVGDTFLSGTTRGGIARRLLQLAHELEHIEQYRTGLAGQNNRPEREFLAFYHEGTADEFIGTRRMPDATRRGLIDGALGQYNCLSDQLKTKHLSKQQELLTRRQTVNGTSGNALTNPPSTCVPQ